VSDEPIDEEATADRAAIREWMMRPRRRKNQTKKVERDDKSDLDWDSYL
jgi:hypothetical protein